MPTHAELFRRMIDAALRGPGALPPEARDAAFAGRGPAEALPWVERVRDRAVSIEDEHIAALLAAGYSEDQAFELTICAALGAADHRLRAALAPLGREDG